MNMKNHWLCVLLFIALPSWAVEPFAATPAEAAMCQARVYSRLGPRDQNTMHMHHYCDGLRFLNRAYAAMGNKTDMKYKAGRAISGFNYVLEHTEKNYVMRGEVHIGKAQALKLLGRKGEALAEFHNALKYDVSTPDAYQALADHYLETGNKSKALEMATEGLRRDPDSKGLKRRYTELGGELPYPEPILSTSTEKPQSLPEIVNDQPKVEAVGVERANSVPAEAVSEIKEQKIGSPTNPYCRFCPD